MKKHNCQVCGESIHRKGRCLHCEDSVNTASERALIVHTAGYADSKYTLDDFLEEEGIKEEVEEMATELIDKWKALSWLQKFYYRFIKREFI